MLGDLELRLGRALRAVQELQLALGELGVGDGNVLFQNAPQAAAEARGEGGLAACTIVGHDLPSPGVRQRARPPTARKCAAPDCQAEFMPTPRSRQIYCTERCRSRTGMQRTRERRAAREDQKWRAQTAALREQHRAEGYLNGGS